MELTGLEQAGSLVSGVALAAGALIIWYRKIDKDIRAPLMEELAQVRAELQQCHDDRAAMQQRIIDRVWDGLEERRKDERLKLERERPERRKAKEKDR